MFVDSLCVNKGCCYSLFPQGCSDSPHSNDRIRKVDITTGTETDSCDPSDWTYGGQPEIGVLHDILMGLSGLVRCGWITWGLCDFEEVNCQRTVVMGNEYWKSQVTYFCFWMCPPKWLKCLLPYFNLFSLILNQYISRKWYTSANFDLSGVSVSYVQKRNVIMSFLGERCSTFFYFYYY